LILRRGRHTGFAPAAASTIEASFYSTRELARQFEPEPAAASQCCDLSEQIGSFWMIAKAASLLLALGVGAAPAGAATDPYLWKYRPVLVFAPDPASADLARQKDAVEADAFRARDIVLVDVVGDSVSQQFGPAPAADAAALMRKYGVGRDQFHAILVGKDGGLKLRSAAPLSARRLSSVIDAMPMRRDEMRSSRP
jgi:hypothetical protein